RDRVEILRPYALGLEVGEDAAERFDVEAMLVERRRNHVDAEAPHSAQKAAVARFLDDDRVTFFEQQRIDKLESLLRASRNQDVIGGARDAGFFAELLDEKLAQGTVA